MKKDISLGSLAPLLPVFFVWVFTCGEVFAQKHDTLHLYYNQIAVQPHDTTLVKMDKWIKSLNGKHQDIRIVAYYHKLEFKKYAQERVDEMFLTVNRKARSLFTIQETVAKMGKNYQRSIVDIIYTPSVSEAEKNAITDAGKKKVEAEKAAAEAEKKKKEEVKAATEAEKKRLKDEEKTKGEAEKKKKEEEKEAEKKMKEGEKAPNKEGEEGKDKDEKEKSVKKSKEGKEAMDGKKKGDKEETKQSDEEKKAQKEKEKILKEEAKLQKEKEKQAEKKENKK